MRNFFWRIRIAWTVFRGKYALLVREHEKLLFYMEQCAMFERHKPSDARVRLSSIDKIKDYPYILLFKETVSGNCYVDYCGTEEELEELKNQEITID